MRGDTILVAVALTCMADRCCVQCTIESAARALAAGRSLARLYRSPLVRWLRRVAPKPTSDGEAQDREPVQCRQETCRPSQGGFA